MSTPVQTGYAPVNDLQMYYEIHGKGRPLILLHGALAAIDTSFGQLLPALAETRQVVAVELQAHGRTADIDRPLRYEPLANDVAALLWHLWIEEADLFGWSLGAGVALQVAIRHPEAARKLVLASVTYNSGGLHPGILAGIEHLTPEALAGSPFQEEYAAIAPFPEDWPTLMSKSRELDGWVQDWPPEDISSIAAPALLIIGDSDLVRPEHAVEMFRLFGGGVAGDVAGLLNSQLAVLPGTAHVGLMDRADWLLSMIGAFLDAPMPEAK